MTQLSEIIPVIPTVPEVEVTSESSANFLYKTAYFSLADIRTGPLKKLYNGMKLAMCIAWMPQSANCPETPAISGS